MDAAVELRTNPASKHQIQPEYGEWAGWRGTGRLNPSHETIFSGTYGDREIFIFPVQLTTSRIGNLTRSSYIHTYTYSLCAGRHGAFWSPSWTHRSPHPTPYRHRSCPWSGSTLPYYAAAVAAKMPMSQQTQAIHRQQHLLLQPSYDIPRDLQ